MTNQNWTLYPSRAETDWTTAPSISSVIDAVNRLDGKQYCSLQLAYRNDDYAEDFAIIGGLSNLLYVRYLVRALHITNEDMSRMKILANKNRWNDAEDVIIAVGEGREELYPAFSVPTYIAGIAIERYITQRTFDLPFTDYEWINYDIYSQHSAELTRKWVEIHGDTSIEMPASE